MRFLPKWDNTLLAHADRTRVLAGGASGRRVIGKNGDVAQTFLVDGVVAGTWSVRQEGTVESSRSRRSPAPRAAQVDDEARAEAWPGMVGR